RRGSGVAAEGTPGIQREEKGEKAVANGGVRGAVSRGLKGKTLLRAGGTHFVGRAGKGKGRQPLAVWGVGMGAAGVSWVWGGRGWLHDVFVEPGDDQEDAESDD